jgi:hypothetical protein
MYTKISILCMACTFAFTLAVTGIASGMEPVSGKVAETMNSGGYTYILLETEGKTTWAAIPNTKVAVGDVVKLQPGMVMHNFTSGSINRTFESIIFSSGLAQ